MWPVLALLTFCAAPLVQERSPIAQVPPALVLGRANLRAECDSAGLVEFPYACATAGATTFLGWSPDGAVRLELLDESCRWLAVSAQSRECSDATLVFNCSSGRHVLRVRSDRPGALVYVGAVRGELDAGPPDLAAAERFYWVSAFESAARRLDLARLRRAASEIALIDGLEDAGAVESALRERAEEIAPVRAEIVRALNWPRAEFGAQRAVRCWNAYANSAAPEADAFEFALLPDLADVLAQQGFHAQRLHVWLRQRTLFEPTRPRGHPQIDDALLNCAQISFEFRRFDDARELATEWLSADPQLRIDPFKPEWQRLRTLVGAVAVSQGEIDEARALFEAADEAYRVHGVGKLSQPQFTDFIVVQLNLVALDVESGRVPRAVRRLEGLGALDGLAEPHRTRMERAAELIRARLAWRLGMPRLTLSLIDKAVLARASEPTHGRVDPSVELQLDELRVLALDRLGRCSEAMQQAEANIRALETQRSSASASDFPRRDVVSRLREQRLLRASVLTRAGDASAAELELQELKEQLAATGPTDGEQLLRTLGQLAVLRATSERWGEAVEIETEVLERLRASGRATTESLARVLAELALSLAAVGEMNEAAATLLQLTETLMAQVEATSVLPIQQAEAENHRLRHHRDVAISVSGRLSGRPEVVEHAVALAETLRSAPHAHGARWRGLSADPAVATMRARLSQLASAGLDSPLAARIADRDIAELSARRALLQAELSDLLRARGVGWRPLAVGEVARALGPDAAAIGYLRYDAAVTLGGFDVVDSYLAHVIRADGTLLRVELGPAAPIDEAIAAHRAAVLDPRARAEEVVSRGARLRELVWDPLAPHIADRHQLRVCLDDALHLVPLASLPHGNTVVGDRWRIRIESDFRSVLHAPETFGRPSTLLALGGVDIDAGNSLTLVLRGDERIPDQVEALPRSLDEVRYAAACFGRESSNSVCLLTGRQATKAAFLAAAPSAQVLHIATHAYALDPDDAMELLAEVTPLTLCGLTLSGFNDATGAERLDSVISGAELAALDLSAVQIAVLSSCNSAVGVRRAGVGVSSLRTALHAAGVRSVISTLWSIDDAAALRFSRVLHEGLWEHGLSVAQAFERARSELRDAGAPLRDWGAWLLTGESD